jgi:hypothetical protein
MARWILIISILNFSRQRNRGSNLPTLLGVHLFAKGLKARELDLLARFGVTVSYKTVHRTLEQLGKEGSNALAQAGQLESAVTAYDNFEQVENIKSQRLDENSTFYSVTTGELVKGADIPMGGLRQDMLGNAPLTLDQALRNPGNRLDEIELQVSYTIRLFDIYLIYIIHNRSRVILQPTQFDQHFQMLAQTGLLCLKLIFCHHGKLFIVL